MIEAPLNDIALMLWFIFLGFTSAILFSLYRKANKAYEESNTVETSITTYSKMRI